MVSRKSSVFRKCSFSFTLPRENATHVRGGACAGASDSPLPLLPEWGGARPRLQVKGYL